jgi:16S rRNA (uracil1498-N3)-methyltransferase
MTLHRFFVEPRAIQGDQALFSVEQSHQIRAVLRLRPGEEVAVFDGRGDEWRARLVTVDGQARARIEEKRPVSSEPAVRVVLYQALLKSAKLELVAQKCTEIGMAALAPVVSERCVTAAPGEPKRRRLEAIVREAAEQSGRGVVPAIHTSLSLGQALRAGTASGPTIFLWEEERALRLRDVDLGGDSVEEVSLFVGPEGGFSRDEADLARRQGAFIATLGPRILRAETAGIIGCALLLARFGDLG